RTTGAFVLRRGGMFRHAEGVRLSSGVSIRGTRFRSRKTRRACPEFFAVGDVRANSVKRAAPSVRQRPVVVPTQRALAQINDQQQAPPGSPLNLLLFTGRRRSQYVRCALA